MRVPIVPQAQKIPAIHSGTRRKSAKIPLKKMFGRK
jgi:hypothetical protein